MSANATESHETSEVDESKPCWFVLQTKRHHEAVVQACLEAAGVETYLPRTVRWPRPAVGSAIGPLFPSYLFVRLHLTADYPRVCWTPGVKDFVRLGGSLPSEVPSRVIEFLRGREGQDGLVHCSEGPVPGLKVKITGGPFHDLCGIIDKKLIGGGRVVLLMELLRRQVRVEVSEANLRVNV